MTTSVSISRTGCQAKAPLFRPSKAKTEWHVHLGGSWAIFGYIRPGLSCWSSVSELRAYVEIMDFSENRIA